MEAFAPPPTSPPPLPPPPKYSSGLNIISTTSARTLTSSTVEISSCKSLLVISCFIVVCFVASVTIFLLIRFLSGRLRLHRRSFSSVASFPLSLSHIRSSSNVSDSSTVTPPESGAAALSEKEKLALIDSLPLFSTASLSVLPKSSPDCAVCLSTFLPDDDLRLLPACRHAFHATCIDNWLLVRDNPTCPLCRASVTVHHPPFLLSAPPLIASSGVVSTDTLLGSFRVEMGSVSRRIPSGEPAKPSSARTYSIDSEYDYVVEEEVEAVVAGIPRPTENPEKQPETGAPTGTTAQVAGASSGRSSRWLKDYIDRLSSASSSFSSLHVSGRWSHQYDSGGDASLRRPPS